jgi:hypothetical protein
MPDFANSHTAFAMAAICLLAVLKKEGISSIRMTPHE